MYVRIRSQSKAETIAYVTYSVTIWDLGQAWTVNKNRNKLQLRSLHTITSRARYLSFHFCRCFFRYVGIPHLGLHLSYWLHSERTHPWSLGWYNQAATSEILQCDLNLIDGINFYDDTLTTLLLKLPHNNKFNVYVSIYICIRFHAHAYKNHLYFNHHLLLIFG